MLARQQSENVLYSSPHTEYTATKHIVGATPQPNLTHATQVSHATHALATHHTTTPPNTAAIAHYTAPTHSNIIKRSKKQRVNE